MTPEIRSIGRGRDKTGGHISQKLDSLSTLFAKTVTGEYNQDISFLIVGKKGTGKSHTQLSIGYHTACEIAECVGGHWSDYFDMETNIAVIDPEKANEVMGIQTRYAVKIFDDIGIGWGARNWQQKENKAKNDIFQINRVDNTVQMFSVPSQFLLDKVPRSLVSHYAETYQQYFKLGFVTIKLFEPQTLFREGKIIQPYLSVNRNKFVVYAIPKPPADLAKQYNKIRYDTTQRIVQMRKNQGQDAQEVRKGKGMPMDTSSRTTKMFARAKPVLKRAEEMVLVGADPKQALFDAGRELKVHRDTIKYWVKQGVTKELAYPL